MDSSPISPMSAEEPSAEMTAILRDCRAMYLKELGQLLREAEPVSDIAVETFVQSAGSYFDEMVSKGPRGGFDDAEGLTASRISLVGENDLEMEIRLNEFSGKLLEKTGGDLWRVYLRFVTLLRRPDLPKSDNPVGPKGIAEGLAQMCYELGEGHERTMARIDRMQNYFAENLPVLYTNLNNLFERRHIDAAQPGIIATPDAPHGAKPVSSGLSNPLAALQQNLMALIPGGLQAAGGLGGGNMGAGGVGGYGGGVGSIGGGNAGGSLFSQAMFDRLLSRLDELERSGRFHPPLEGAAGANGGAPSLENLIPGLFDGGAAERELPRQSIRSAALGIPKAAPEAAAIDTLALVFEAIFDMPDLPDAIKSALSSLQIPLLKAAMLDPSFFSNENHPARTLLDRMARAALGLPADVSSKHPVCLQIVDVAAHVRNEFSTDSAVFERYVAKMDTLIAERDQEIAEAALVWLPLIARMDQRGKAEIRCQEVILGFCERGIPQGIADFLNKYWYRVLLQVWVEHGEESAAWQEHNSVIDSLLWSVQPKSDAEDRKRLSRMLPGMLQMLSKGMEHLKVPDDERTAFLDTCFSLQTAALRGVAQAPAERVATSDAPALDAGLLSMPSALPEAGEVHAGDLCLKTIDIPGESALLGRLRSLPLKVGEWLEFKLLDGSTLIGRLCHSSPDSGKLLLCNNAWCFAVAIHPAVMERQLREQQAQRLSSRSLFNLAAEKALNRPAEA